MRKRQTAHFFKHICHKIITQVCIQPQIENTSEMCRNNITHDKKVRQLQCL